MPLTQGGYTSTATASQSTGYGTAGTRIRRFAAGSVIGSDITYADSAADGASFTINVPGVYAINYTDAEISGFGISQNATGASASTSAGLLNVGQILAVVQTRNPAEIATASTVRQLAAGTVIKPHSFGGASAGNTAASFSIRRIG